MFNFNKKDESYYIKEILNMNSYCKREYSSEEQRLKEIKQAIMTINTNKIQSKYIKDVQDNISNLTFKEQSDYSTMRKVIKDWEKYNEEINN